MVYPDSAKNPKTPLAKRRDPDSTERMIRPGFLDIELRQNLIELAQDGSAAHRLARRANALVLLRRDAWSARCRRCPSSAAQRRRRSTDRTPTSLFPILRCYATRHKPPARQGLRRASSQADRRGRRTRRRSARCPARRYGATGAARRIPTPRQKSLLFWINIRTRHATMK